jgi:hypothetical protein
MSKGLQGKNQRRVLRIDPNHPGWSEKMQSEFGQPQLKHSEIQQLNNNNVIIWLARFRPPLPQIVVLKAEKKTLHWTV